MEIFCLKSTWEHEARDEWNNGRGVPIFSKGSKDDVLRQVGGIPSNVLCDLIDRFKWLMKM